MLSRVTVSFIVCVSTIIVLPKVAVPSPSAVDSEILKWMSLLAARDVCVLLNC